MIEAIEFEQQILILRMLLEERDMVELSFKGTSMLPVINPGAVLQVIKCKKLRVGGIYLYVDRDPDSYSKIVAHRLIKYADKCYYFKGDNRSRIDDPVAKKDVIGEIIKWN